MRPDLPHDDAHWLSEAVALARDAVQAGGIPFAALVVADGKEVGRGVNRVLTDCDPTAHAEVTAIREACRQLGLPSLSGATLFASAEPCALCLLTAASAGVSRIAYALSAKRAAAHRFDYQSAYRLLSPTQHWPVRIVHRPVPEAEEPFHWWQRRRAGQWRPGAAPRYPEWR